MPSSRALATQLGLARGTVVEVYTQLAAEGYLRTRPGAATRWRADRTFRHRSNRCGLPSAMRPTFASAARTSACSRAPNGYARCAESSRPPPRRTGAGGPARVTALARRAGQLPGSSARGAHHRRAHRRLQRVHPGAASGV
ncbi:GntR family transcriptional regulator [Mycobacterium intracellulare]|uniref:GntR family transcriptional regulator n=1 Tax=Mycobacterium intracellulare TaxID=1767 RepID=UPI001E2DA37B|nr:GntR family transcriptional regulator [Mycobacterium intracellulare]